MPSADFNTPRGPGLLSHSVGLRPCAGRAAPDASFLEPWAAGSHTISVRARCAFSVHLYNDEKDTGRLIRTLEPFAWRAARKKGIRFFVIPDAITEKPRPSGDADTSPDDLEIERDENRRMV